jgi:hypothetical protein
MATFIFNCGFYLLLDDGNRIRFEAGEQDVPDAIAGHPYLAANGERVEKPAPVIQTAPETEPEPATVTTTAEPQSEAPAAEPSAEEPAVDPAPAPEAVEPADDVPERDALVAQAEALGINVDGRWGTARLKAEIAKVTG